MKELIQLTPHLKQRISTFRKKVHKRQFYYEKFSRIIRNDFSKVYVILYQESKMMSISVSVVEVNSRAKASDLTTKTAKGVLNSRQRLEVRRYL